MSTGKVMDTLVEILVILGEEEKADALCVVDILHNMKVQGMLGTALLWKEKPSNLRGAAAVAVVAHASGRKPKP